MYEDAYLELTLESQTLRKPIIVRYSSNTSTPKFNMTEFEIKPLTCTTSDLYWNMKVPPVDDADTQTVNVTLLTESEIFSYSSESGIIFLKS